MPACNLPATICAVAFYRDPSARTGRASLAQHANVHIDWSEEP